MYSREPKGFLLLILLWGLLVLSFLIVVFMRLGIAD